MSGEVFYAGKPHRPVYETCFRRLGVTDTFLRILEDARRRLAELIAAAHVRQAKRRPTKPSRAAKAKRVDAKKGRGEVKAGRGRVRVD